LIESNDVLQLENKLLRNKIISLNQELLKINQHLEKFSFMAQDSQKNIHEKENFRAKKHTEEEFEASLENKDPQISKLQMKVDEGLQELRSRDEKIHHLQEKVDQLLKEKEAYLHSKQLLKDKEEKFEKTLRNEEEAHAATRQRAQNRERELEENIEELTTTLARNQRSLEDKSVELLRVLTQLKEFQENNKSLKQEFSDYKIRATKVLQEKDKTIKELSIQLSNPESARQEINLVELISLQQERDSLREERDALKLSVEQTRNNLSDIQTQFEFDMENLQSQIKDLEENLEKEQKRVQVLQMELLVKSQESLSIKDENEKRVESYNTLIRNRDEEIQNLKRRLAAKSLSSSSQEELENRFQLITENLIQKQNQLEAVATEKAYMQLQLEAALQSLNEKKHSQDEHHSIIIDDAKKRRHRDDLSGPRLRPIASLVESSNISSHNSALGRRVVRAANFIDLISTITGSYLRHSPLARLGVIFYVFLMHFWVLYVFMTWNPEIHSNDSPNK